MGTPGAAGVGDTGVDLVGGMALDLVDDLDLEGTGVDLVVDLEDSEGNLVGMAADSVGTAGGTLLGTPEAEPLSAAGENHPGGHADAASQPGIAESTPQSHPIIVGFVFGGFSFLVVWILSLEPAFLWHFSLHQSLASIHQPAQIERWNLSHLMILCTVKV